MDGRWGSLRIDEENVDSLIAQAQLQLGREPGGGGGSVSQRMIHFDQQIDIATTRGIVRARSEQQHTGAWSEIRLGRRSDDSCLDL
jgi:hypothetical protein